MYQGWQRKSAKGYWRLKKQPAKGKSENDFRKQFYTTGCSLKLLIITALMATSILTLLPFSTESPALPGHLLQTVSAPQPSSASSPTPLPASSLASSFTQKRKPLNQAFHTFPPPTFQGAPTSLLFQWINRLCCPQKLKSNHVTPLLKTLLDPLLTQSWSQSLHEGRLGPASSQPCRLSFRPARSFHPPAAVLEEAVWAAAPVGASACALPSAGMAFPQTSKRLGALLASGLLKHLSREASPDLPI